jgi:hypothetical protein
MSSDLPHDNGATTTSPSATPLEALRRVLARRPDARDDPDALRNLLLDYCPTHRSEINWLVNAAVERVPARIAGAGDDTPRDVLIGAVRSTLVTDVGMSADAAAWTAGAWYDALRGTDTRRGMNDRSEDELPAEAGSYGALAGAESHGSSATVGSRESPADVGSQVLPGGQVAPKAPELTMDMLRGTQDVLVGRAWRSLVIAIVVSAAVVVLLLQVQFFSDDLFGRLEGLRARNFNAVITGNPQQPAGIGPLLLYAALTGVIIAVIRKRLENLSLADRRRRMWSPNPNDWTN